MKSIVVTNNKITFNMLFKPLIILSFIYMSWVIFCGRFYIDDLGRSLYGYTAWGYDGRPLSDLVMTILSMGSPLLDLTPIPQILAVFALSSSLAFWGVKYFNKSDPYLISAGLFFFISTPLFIENLSYKYDSLPMSLSVAVLLLSFGFKNRKVSFFLTSVSAIISLSLYQASIGLFITLTIIDLIHGRYLIINKSTLKDSLTTASIYALSFLIGVLFYKFVIVKIFASGGYSDLHSKTIPLDKNFLNHMIINIKKIYDWFLTPLFESSKYIFTFTFIALLSSILLISISTTDRFINKIANCFVLLALALLIFLSSFIHIALLNEPVFAPRVLISMTGFGLFTSYLIISAFKCRVKSYILITPYIVFSMIFSFSYANASKAQERTDELLSTSIYNDASHKNHSFDSVIVFGLMPSSLQRELIISRFPIMNSLIPLYLNNNWSWGSMLLKHYNLNLKPTEITADFKVKVCNETPFIDAKDYLLYALDHTLVIVFNKGFCS